MSIREINVKEEIPRYTNQEIIDILKPIIGKTLGQIDKNNVFEKTKMNYKVTGIAGDVIEQSVFEYKANNKQIPDLNIDGIDTELKTIGLKGKNVDSNKKEYMAKEPCSITAVSINTIVSEEFDTSKFWHKSEYMLFVYYIYLARKTVSAAMYRNFPIKNFCFYHCTGDDRKIIEADWQKVHDFIASVQENYPNEEDRRKQYPYLSTIINKLSNL